MTTVMRYQPQLNNAALAWRLGRYTRIASRLYGTNLRQTFRRGLFLIRRLRFTPEEALKFGLFDPALGERDLHGFMSKRTLSAAQNRLNPGSWYHVTEDKAIFYRMCEGIGISVPTLYALAFRGHRSWTCTGVSPSGPAEWGNFIDSLSPRGVTVKPCRSVHGKAVHVFSRNADGDYENGEGRAQNAHALGQWLWDERLASGLLVQQRIYNHPDFKALSSTDYLQTVRVMTYVALDGEPRIIVAFLKVIRTSSQTDNFAFGRTGNIVLRLDESTSEPLEVMEGDTERGTVRRCSWAAYCQRNPAVDKAFRVPQWEEVRQLARQLALRFQPLRAVGWDIAVTVHGPVVVEGNFRADPFASAGLRELLAPMLEEAAAG